MEVVVQEAALGAGAIFLILAGLTAGGGTGYLYYQHAEELDDQEFTEEERANHEYRMKTPMGIKLGNYKIPFTLLGLIFAFWTYNKRNR